MLKDGAKTFIFNFFDLSGSTNIKFEIREQEKHQKQSILSSDEEEVLEAENQATPRLQEEVLSYADSPNSSRSNLGSGIGEEPYLGSGKKKRQKRVFLIFNPKNNVINSPQYPILVILTLSDSQILS